MKQAFAIGGGAMATAKKSAADKVAELETRIATLKARRDRIQARENAAERKADTRRKIIVGAAVLAHAQQDAKFALALRDALTRGVTREKDRETIADLLK